MNAIKKLDYDIEVGSNDLELYLDITLNGSGEVLVDKKADSLVANFSRILMSFMANKYIEDGLFFNNTDSATLKDTGESFNVIASVTPGNPTRVAFDGNISRFNNGGTQGIQIMGVGGITPDINGFHGPVDITYISDSIVDIAIDTTSSPAFVDEGARARLWEDVAGIPIESAQYTLSGFVIKVGRDGTANVTDQQSLLNEYDSGSDPFEIVYSGARLAFPTFGPNAGEIFFSTIVTNNSDAPIDINEMGMYSRIEISDDRHTLIARDTVTATIPVGESATVNYRLKTNLSAGGGLLKQFLLAVYRQLTISSGTGITEINGSNDTSAADNGMFLSVGNSGNGYFITSSSGYSASFIGVQVGGGNTAVAIDDYALETRIANGENGGELITYGGSVQEFDITGSEVTFKIIRFFENASGGDVDINELGLYCGTDGFNGQVPDVICIYREVLGSTETVADGEIVKVTLTFKLTVA